MEAKNSKGKKKFAWRLFLCYSGDSSQYHIRNDNTEMFLLDEEPTAQDLRRFYSEYIFKKCFHSQIKSPGHVEYCGWMRCEIKRGDDKRKHSVLTPSCCAEVDRYDLEKMVINLKGRNRIVWRSNVPVPIYKSLDEYFAEQEKKEKELNL